MIIDVETTGTGRHDRIVDLAINDRSWRFNPGLPIPADATAIHGITDADVVDRPTFAEGCAEPVAMLRAATEIVGFNVRFDIDMINAELDRADLPLLDLPPVIIDVRLLWSHLEPRTLTAAVEKFCARKHEGAHGALADVAATRDVLAALMAKTGMTAADVAAVADPLKERAAWCGPTDDLLWRDGLVVLNFGKHKGTPIHELDAGMLRWLVENARAKHVRATARLAMTPDKFLERLRNRRAA